MSRPHFNLLRNAYSIIDGIPAKAINLNLYVSRLSRKEHKIKVACPAGWLTQHPKFRALGLALRNDRSFSGGFGVFYEDLRAFEGLDKLFQFNHAASSILSHLYISSWVGHIFCEHGIGYKDKELTLKQLKKLSHKKLWQRRVLRFLQDSKQPFDERLGRGLYLPTSV